MPHHSRPRPPFTARRAIRLGVGIALAAVVFPVLLAVGARYGMWAAARDRVFDDVAAVPATRVALVLGAGVGPDGQLSVHLRDRVDAAIQLYRAGKVAKLLMSGDNRFLHYNEPDRMKEYAVRAGVPASDAFCDYAGRRTYDSVYRAKHIFGLSQVTVVTQRFHLDRALFLCEHLGVDAYGLAADQPGHRNTRIEFREFPACVLTLVDVYIHQPRPVMGEREDI